MKITICGSMKFANVMKEVNKELSMFGHCVWCPIMDLTDIDSESIAKLKKVHLTKIRYSDCIYVVDVDHYIGESVKDEIDHAINNNVSIIFHSTAPKRFIC